MAKTLDEIRKKLQALDNRKTGGFTGDKLTYAHWNIPEGTSAILRILPDANEDNTFFWQEKQMINLTFPGIKGQDENKEVEVSVPCIEMYEGFKNKCPILGEVRPWWKDKSLEDTARKYWVKRSYYMQGFVMQDPMNETDAPENPIRRFSVKNQIFTLIKAALMDPDMEHSPVDYINGTDFIVSKTSKAGYADYTTSKWARRESSITEEMQAAIKQYGLVDLRTYLPKQPDAEHLAAMFDMFQDSLNGDLYDGEKYAQFYKPYGYDSGTEAKPVSRVAVSAPAVTVQASPARVSVPVTEDEDLPFTPDVPKNEPVAATAGKSPQDILTMLRNRNQTK